MSASESLDVVIVAAGSGKRLGFPQPKAFVPLGGKPLLLYSLETFLHNEKINKIILVVPLDMYPVSVKRFSIVNKIEVVVGGAERWHSVANGVGNSDAEWVLVHDAARPFVTAGIIDRLLEKKSQYECAVTVTPEVDTIRTFENDRACSTIDREKLVRVGTPQLFLRSKLVEALKTVSELSITPTDEAMLMQHCGIQVGIAWGDPMNFKITTPSDLEIAEAIVERKSHV